MLPVKPAKARAPGSARRRAFWMRQLHRWHWISSAMSLVGLLLFAITGITLNHAGDISAEPVTAERTATLTGPARDALARGPQDGGTAALPDATRAALAEQLSTRLPVAPAEWSEEEVFLAIPRAGGDATLTIDRATGNAVLETTDRGWVAYFNDLHKGRNTGSAWTWFIDIFAGACLVFALTGMFLLHLHSRNRPATWPLVGFGLAIPAILAIFFLH